MISAKKGKERMDGIVEEASVSNSSYASSAGGGGDGGESGKC